MESFPSEIHATALFPEPSKNPELAQIRKYITGCIQNAGNAKFNWQLWNNKTKILAIYAILLIVACTVALVEALIKNNQSLAEFLLFLVGSVATIWSVITSLMSIPKQFVKGEIPIRLQDPYLLDIGMNYRNLVSIHQELAERNFCIYYEIIKTYGTVLKISFAEIDPLGSLPEAMILSSNLKK